MSLTATVSSAVDAAFAALGDMKTTGTLWQVPDVASYDDETDEETVNKVDHDLPEVALVRYKEDEVDGTSIKETDVKALIPGSDLTYIPTTDDEYEDDEGNAYSIERVHHLPGKVLWVLQLRLM